MEPNALYKPGPAQPQEIYQVKQPVVPRAMPVPTAPPPMATMAMPSLPSQAATLLPPSNMVDQLIDTLFVTQTVDATLATLREIHAHCEVYMVTQIQRQRLADTARVKVI